MTSSRTASSWRGSSGDDDLGDADRACRARLGHGRARRAERDAGRRAEGEPVVGGMVERERDLGDVDVRPAERPADDGVARLRDRRAALDGRREADPEQPVVAVVVMERRRQLDAVDAGPQPDLLLAARRLERAVEPDPLADRRDLDGDLRVEVDRRREPAVGRQVPRAFGEERMVRVLAIRRAARWRPRPAWIELLAAALVDEAGDPAAARRIDRQREGLVLDGQACRPPASRHRRAGVAPGTRVERPVADGGHVAGQERDRRAGAARPTSRRIGRFDHERDALAARRRRSSMPTRTGRRAASTSTRAMSVRGHDSALKTVTAWPSPAVSIAAPRCSRAPSRTVAPSSTASRQPPIRSR